MDDSRSKTEVIQPVILKAGIPLAVSLAGLVLSKIISRKKSKPCTNSAEDQGENFRSTNSTSWPEDGGLICERPDLETEVLELRGLVEGLQDKEQQLEFQFLRYCDLKDREIVLMEIGNMLKTELARIEALNREVSWMEAENQRVGNMVLEYVKVLEEMQFLESENRVLRKKVEKLCQKVRQQANVIVGTQLRVEAQEREISRQKTAMENGSSAVEKMESDVRELKASLEQLKAEKNEISVKLNFAEQSISKIKEETLSIDDYNYLLKELEQLQKEHALEEEELVNLRWSTACLRHELMRTRLRQDQEQNPARPHANCSSQLAVPEKNGHECHDSDHEPNSSVSPAGLSSSSPSIKASSSDVPSKRRKLLQKLKNWVEGNNDHGSVKGREITEGEKNQKCFGRRSVSDQAEEEEENEAIDQARRSCSSV